MNHIKEKLDSLLGLGSLRRFMHNPVAFQHELARQGRPVLRLRFATKQFVFIFDPGLAQEVLVRQAPAFSQNRMVFGRIRPVTGAQGLVQLEGEASKQARLKARALFSGESLQRAGTIVEGLVGQKLRELESSHFIEPAEVMTSLILQTAIRIFLGPAASDLHAGMQRQFLRLNELCGLRMRSLFPAPLFLPTRENREIHALRGGLRAGLAKHFRESSSAPEGVPHAFSGDPALADHCLTFLFAGHETTASSLAFTLLLLAQHPGYQEEIAAGNPEATLRAYKESLRLYPPAYMLAREARAGISLHGHNFEKGDQVVIALAAIQRSEELFENAQEFRPERFEEKLRHPFAFFPFGAGGKNCVGERLAYLEATIVLQQFCRKFRLEAPPAELRAKPLITLHPAAGQRIRIRSREESHARAI